MHPSRKTTLLLVEDHPLFRQGLREMIRAHDRFEIVAEAENGPQAVQLIQQHKPEIVILDVNLPGLNGFEVVAALQTKRFHGRWIMLTMYNDEEILNKALDLGVMGYVLKENAITEIINCLNSVAAGEPYLTPAVTRYLLQRRRSTEALRAARPSLEDLTKAERRILKLVAQGKSSKEIGELLFISPRTVDVHRSKLRSKLDLKGDNTLLRFAIENRHAINQLTED